MAIDIRFEIPDAGQSHSAQAVAVSKVVVQGRRELQLLYGYGGQPVALFGRAGGMLVVTVEMPAGSIAAGDALLKAVEGVRGKSRFTVNVGGVMSVDGCSAGSGMAETVTLSPGANAVMTWRMAISGCEPRGVSSANGWLAGGDYVLPSMPDLSGLSAEMSSTTPMSPHAVLCSGIVNASGMPATQFTISGTMYSNARIPSDLVPLIENAPRDPAAAYSFPSGLGSPLMEVSLGWQGSRRLVRNAVNTESSFEFGTGQSGMEIKASRTFQVLPSLAPDA